jgi:hypothetical protein
MQLPTSPTPTTNRKPRNPFADCKNWEVSENDEVLTEQLFVKLIEVERYDVRLPRYLAYWLGTPDAQDIAQESWITILEKIRAGQTIYARGLFRYACRVDHGN